MTDQIITNFNRFHIQIFPGGGVILHALIVKLIKLFHPKNDIGLRFKLPSKPKFHLLLTILYNSVGCWSIFFEPIHPNPPTDLQTYPIRLTDQTGFLSVFDLHVKHTVESVFFACPLFRDVAKIKSREYLTSHAILRRLGHVLRHDSLLRITY